jgi:hypothetical protein
MELVSGWVRTNRRLACGVVVPSSARYRKSKRLFFPKSTLVVLGRGQPFALSAQDDHTKSC